MHVKKRDVLTISLLLMMSLTLFVNNMHIHAIGQSTRVQVINPRTGKSDFLFYTGTDPMGTRFNATAWVYDVNDLFAYQVCLTYNSTLLNATRAWLPPKLDPQWVFKGKSTVRPAPYFYKGAVLIGDSLYEERDMFDGTGLLAIIEFEIVYKPPSGEVFSDLSIVSEDTMYTYLLNYDLSEMPFEKEGGHYKYKYAVVNLEVKPNRYVADKLETFNVTVWLNNASQDDRIVGAQFRLQYNAALLEVVSVSEGPFFRQFKSRAEEPYTFFMYYNITRAEEDPKNFADLGAHILVGIAILSNETGQYSNFPKVSGILATVTFRGRYRSFFPLNSTFELADITIVDDAEIPNVIATAPPRNGVYEISRMQVLPVLIVQPNVSEAKKKDEIFKINVTVSDLHPDAQLSSLEFKHTYNATTLEVLNITEGSFLGEFGSTAFNYSVGSGSVTVQTSLKPSFTSFPGGNGTIATITFKAIYRGLYPEETNSSLDLTEIVLLDVYQNNISTSAPMNGFYKIFSLRPPVVKFTYSPSKPVEAQKVVFNASDSYDHYPGAVVSYVWNFGDGNTTTVTSPIITHVYVTPGTYNVTLTVIDDDELSSSDSETVLIEAQPTGIPLYIVIITVLAAIVIIAAIVTYYKKIKKHKPTTL